ncbi:MAG: acetyl-CoA C-acyltransferase [Ignavibacteria bacterium]|nr:acetyl-CoA C-acyltransferase [Ignavibacteria bacterium]OIO16428.1 MAG: acetyl-CoA acetyltransferase [Ignavibacteria bacterium CG1_02_37_35]PIX95378.1 MAG: acetyl-CoA C-acyltransferase [Ignavibacteria bacterium CG_4_10_14_3_um_filter_37_18]
MREAYIVAGYRSAVAKAKKGGFRFYRPDDLAADVIRHLIKQVPQLDLHRVDDVIVGNAFPEAEQGLQIGRMIALQVLPVEVPGSTVNRFCASGVDSIATAVARIKSGMMDCIIAGGTESMSMVPMTGWKLAPNYKIAKEHPEFYMGMGLTSEEVARDYKISRQDQDEFAYHSHMKAINAQKEGYFKEQIVPVEVEEVYVENRKRKVRKFVVDKDEGPRADTTIEALAKLKPAFASDGTATAGNSSQTSDGAAFVLVLSEEMVKELNVKPIARMVSYAVAGVDPRVMGIGPIEAIPKALKKANLKLDDIELIELNEAFASQSLAVARTLGLNNEILNVNGGAIALGHPLGCTGAKLTVQILNELKRRKKKYGMISACVGGGQGVAAIYEVL